MLAIFVDYNYYDNTKLLYAFKLYTKYIKLY